MYRTLNACVIYYQTALQRGSCIIQPEQESLQPKRQNLVTTKLQPGFPLADTTCEDESHGGRGVRDQNHLVGLLDFLPGVQFKIWGCNVQFFGVALGFKQMTAVLSIPLDVGDESCVL